MDILAEAATPPTRDTSLLDVIASEIQAGNVALPPLPEIALEVRRLIDTDSEIQEIAKAVEQDQGYAAAILRYANSVAFAGLKQVADLPGAMQRLGLKAVEQTVLALSAQEAFATDDPADERTFRVLWEHSLTTAMSARRLAGGGISPELAFLAGLLHDVGKVVVLRCVADLRRRSPERFSLSELALLEVLDELHCTVGDHFLETWSIPKQVRDAVRRHHDPELGPADRLAAIVACADRVAAKIGVSLRPAPELDVRECPAAALLGLDDEAVATLLVDVEADVAGFKGE